MIIDPPRKEEYAKCVCLFLAEGLRNHKISLKRAADIGQKVIDHLNLVDSEQDFLRLVKDLESDFEELISLEKIVLLNSQKSDREKMEALVREYVIAEMAADPKLSLSLLTAATNDQATLTDLKNKFPQFAGYLEQKNVRK